MSDIKDLENQVKYIANTIEQGTWEDFEATEEDPEPNAFLYLQDALDIQYIVNSKREYLGARVLVAFGGPNIWIDTQRKVVEGYWWGSKAVANYQQDGLELDDVLSQLWSC